MLGDLTVDQYTYIRTALSPDEHLRIMLGDLIDQNTYIRTKSPDEHLRVMLGALTVNQNTYTRTTKSPDEHLRVMLGALTVDQNTYIRTT